MEKLIILLFIAGMLSLILIGKHNAKRAKDQLRFDMQYYCANRCVDLLEVNESNYHLLFKQVWGLDNIPHRDKEKIAVLKTKFVRKYEEIKMEMLSEDEHSPAQIFSEYN